MQITENFYSYDSDFLNSEDVTAYLNRNDDLAPVIVDGQVWWYNLWDGEMVCLGSPDQMPSLPPGLKRSVIQSAVESDIPLDLYKMWSETSPGHRTGMALLRFQGNWYIAMRNEIPSYEDAYSSLCNRAPECLRNRWLAISKCEEAKDFIFLFSGVDPNISWPPQNCRCWVLLPANIALSRDTRDFADALGNRLMCTYCSSVDPDECKERRTTRRT